MAKSKKKSKQKGSHKKNKPGSKITTQKKVLLHNRISNLGIALFFLGVIFILIYASVPAFKQLVKTKSLKILNSIQLSKNELSTSEEREAFPPPKQAIVKDEITLDEFVGADSCAECHKEQYDLWKNSTHGRAGGPPNSRTVIGKFNGKTLRFKDARVTPFINSRNEYIFSVEQNGFPKKNFRVDALVGAGHMEGGGTQTYFSQFPDGTLRFLPFDFIRKEDLWFGETKNSQGWIPINKDLSITDLSEWPPSRILGAEPAFSNCQECHVSQIQVNFDVPKKRYVTEYTSLAINCESCHGPQKRHVELARSKKINEMQDIGTNSLTVLTKDQSLQVCFRCHALKDVLHTGYLPGKDILYYYALKFPILGDNPYHPDGRIRVFGYQINHLFSDCYINGSMTCVDCHDPHELAYRDITGKKLIGKFDNGQCTDCHASKAQAPEKHSYHKPDSTGNLCVGCHMPFLQHKAMGTKLRFARSDHTIPIPRPIFDAQLGIENACIKCHKDKTNAWQQAKTEEWYGELKPHKNIITNLIKAKNISDRKIAANLVLVDSTNHTIAQIAGLSFFIQKFLSPNIAHLEPEIITKLMNLCEKEDVDLKSLALMSLHLAQDQNADIHAFLLNKLKTLDSEELYIRDRWSIALAYLGGVYRDKGEFENSILTYKKALEIMPDDPDILQNIGLTYSQNSDIDNAIASYKKSLAIQPYDSMTWVNLGMAYRNKGDLDSALSAYKKAVEVNPGNALAHFNLGNYYYRKDDLKNAIFCYTRAVELDPSLSSGHFNLARVYIKTKNLEKAATSLRAGLQYDPEDQGSRKMLKDIEAFLSNR